MPQLTGLQIGTPQSDLFTGSLEIADFLETASEIGIFEATVNAFGGDDTIEGIVTLVPDVDDLTLTATGIANSTINAGAGNDIVLGRGAATQFFERFDIRGPVYSGEAFSYGLASSIVNGGSGNDTLTFISTTAQNANGPSITTNDIGVMDATINGDSGSDTITLQGSLGALNSTVHGGAQQDTITITAVEGSFNPTAAEQSLIKGGNGDDAIMLAARAQGTVSTLLSTRVRGGQGNDTLTITSDTLPVSANNLPSSVGITLEDNSVVSGGAGDDLITIRANTSGAGGASAAGLSGSRALGGAGNDTITISAAASGFGVPYSYAALESTVSGGRGNDVIELSAFGMGSSVRVAAANQSTIRGGSGDDTLTFKISGNTGSAGQSASIIDTKVYGNSGNDTITVEVIPFENASDANQVKYDIADALIFGGDGDDTFEVGIGTGTLRGGNGVDLAVIDYFNAESMNVSAIANGVQIVGSQTKSGTAGEWIQNIVGVESFQIGSALYTAETLVATFTG